jgi:hypothetical protein
MIDSPLMEGSVAGDFTDALPLRIRVVLDGVWAGSGDLLKNVSSSSVLVYLSANIFLLAELG